MKLIKSINHSSIRYKEESSVYMAATYTLFDAEYNYEAGWYLMRASNSLLSPICYIHKQLYHALNLR